MTVLLMSSAYATEELIAEFGKLPPSFLPIGNQRLYQLQTRLLQRLGRPIVLTLPEDFAIPSFDHTQLDELGVEVLRVPTGLRLGEALVYALNCVGVGSGPVSVLHGDTYFNGDLPGETDAVSIHSKMRNYSWASFVEAASGGHRFANCGEAPANAPVLSGFFAFSDARSLIKALTRARGEFIEGLNLYDSGRLLAGVYTQGTWLDFGHVQTYYRSRWHLTSQRAFNNLRIEGDVVSKTSESVHKIHAEANWYESIPASLKLFAPMYLGRVGSEAGIEAEGYQISHEYLATLSDLFVFGALPEASWVEIFEGCGAFLDTCSAFTAAEGARVAVANLYRSKARERVEAYCRAEGLNPQAGWRIDSVPVPGLSALVETLADIVDAGAPERTCVMHGDFCFSNILFDFRRGAVKVIDPRGQIGEDDMTIYGDPRYDVAKLSHSVIGLYDFVTAGAFALERPATYALALDFQVSPATKRLQGLFSEMTFGGIRPLAADVRAGTALLFLSMLPLHGDNPRRQIALLARGLGLARDVLEVA